MSKKISELTAAGALTGTEQVEVVQSSASRRTTAQDIADLAGIGITNSAAANELMKSDGTNAVASGLFSTSSGELLVNSSASIMVATSTGSKAQIHSTDGSAAATIARYSDDSNGPNIQFGKSRSTAVGGFTAVQNNDRIGRINWCAADGTDLLSISASIYAEIDGAPGSNDVPGRLIFLTTADGSDSPSERLRINESGSIGIGTQSPSARLHVARTSNDIIITDLHDASAAGAIIRLRHSRNATIGSHTVLQNGDTIGEITFSGSDGTNYINGARITAAVSGSPGTNDMPTAMFFWTTPDGSASPQTRMSLLSDGVVVIGDTTGTRILEVAGSVAIMAGTSTGRIARVGGVIKTDTTTTGNVGAGDDTLQTYSVPANTLATNGDTLSGTCAGTFGANANNKRLRVKFGATTIFDSGSIAWNTGDWVLQFEIVRTGATTQKAFGKLTTSNSSLYTFADYATAAETLSGAVTLLVTGEATTDNDIVKEMFKLRWEPSE